MKKYLILSLLLLAFTLNSFAEANLDFIFNEAERTCTLISAENLSGDVIIPSKVEKEGIEYEVTEISGYAKLFNNCHLTSVTIPESITEIGNSFNGSYVQTVFYNATCADVDTRAFFQANFDNVIIGQNVKKIPNFNGGQGWPTYTLEFWQGAEDIASPGKNNIIHLTDIDEWAMNPPIGFQATNAFEYEFNVLSNKIQNVKAYFNGEPIKKLTLGSRVTKIAPYAFAGFSDIQSIILNDYISEIGNGSFAGTSITSISIPESITEIGDYSFAGCDKLVEASLPSSLTTLSEGIFAFCSALYDIKLPENLREINNCSFYRCSDLEEIILPKSLTAIGDMAFKECSKLKIPDFPVNLVTIGEQAYYENTFSGELKFGNKLRSIGSKAFAAEFGLTSQNVISIYFSEGLQKIGSGAFEFTNIKDIILPQSLISIGNGAFRYANLNTINIPEGITEIPAYSFEHSSLKSIILPNTLEEIGDKAFYCSKLTQILLPESLKNIGREAFWSEGFWNDGVYNEMIFNTIKIPDAVTSIGENALGKVLYLTLGSGITSIESSIAESVDVLEMKTSTPPYLGTDRLGFIPKIVIVPEGAENNYTSSVRWKDYNISARNSHRATVYVNEPGTLAVECRIQSGFLPGQVTNLIVEGSLNDDDFAVMRSNMTACYSIDLSKVNNTMIPHSAFEGKDILLEMTLPYNTKKIGSQAFENCYVMNIKNIPAQVDSIYYSAFKNCRNLSIPLEFPSTLEYIGEEAFCNCSSLPSVDFSACPNVSFSWRCSTDYHSPDRSKGIFSHCNNLTQVILPNNMTEIPGVMFYGSGLRSLQIPSTVTSIGEMAFANTEFLKEVTFPESVESIKKWAFYNSGIESADMPNSLKSISESAFEKSSLVFVDIKDGIDTLDNKVFSNCPDLMVVNLPSTLQSLGNDALASPSLTAITSASQSPATTNSGSPFSGVDNYICALTIPKISYSKYLSAEYWGAFVNIRNWIDVTLPENTDQDSSSDNDELEVTYMDENDYQDMLEDDMQDAEEQTEQSQTVYSKPLRVLSRLGAIGKARGYGRLFNGASLFAADNSRTRIFINAPESFENLKVFYNGKDVTSEIDKETMSFVTPELTSLATLEIKGNYSTNGIEEIEANRPNAPIFTLTGTLAGYGEESLNRLPAGIYIFCGRKVIIK